MTHKSLAAAAVTVLLAIAGCSPRDENTARQLQRVGTAHQHAETNCRDYQTPRCRRSITHYQHVLVSAYHHLDPKAQRTIRHAYRVDRAAVRQAVKAIDARDLLGWLDALRQDARAGALLNAAQLR
jgi:ABC-type branched-subunit amino acid transport system ATPase component